MYTISAVGQDSHRFTEGTKPLILGGIRFDGSRGLEANSDGDVVLHAVTNAVSGLTGVNILGRIADEMCVSGITDSAEYLKRALQELPLKNMRLVHISISIECAEPKISPYINSMKEKIGGLCGILPLHVGITATTGERLTAFGMGEGIAVTAIATAQCLHEQYMF